MRLIIPMSQDIMCDTITSFFTIKNDTVNAGTDSIDRKIVVGGKLITSRGSEDLSDFMRAIIKALS